MIQVLLFAQLQEKVGKPKLMIDEQAITVEELKKKHLGSYEMEDLLNEAMIAVNEEYAEANTAIHAGDVVAFIPPVSGG